MCACSCLPVTAQVQQLWRMHSGNWQRIHSHAQKRLHGQVDAIFEDLEAGAYPSYKAANHLRYLDAVVREMRRLHPPAAGVARSNIEVD
jgi:cytochrome P450